MHAAALGEGSRVYACSSPVVRGALGPEHMHAAALKGGVLNICMQQL